MCLLKDDYIWSPQFFGDRLAFLMNLLPIIPELLLLAMLPFWAMYWSLQAVRRFTQFVDNKWQELGDD